MCVSVLGEPLFGGGGSQTDMWGIPNLETAACVVDFRVNDVEAKYGGSVRTDALSFPSSECNRFAPRLGAIKSAWLIYKNVNHKGLRI